MRIVLLSCHFVSVYVLIIQIVPDSFRGAIVGLSSLAPAHKRALYITFGSVSLGIPCALSRVFTKVYRLLSSFILQISSQDYLTIFFKYLIVLGGCVELQPLLQAAR